ncbi:MAG: DUF2070 family protein [Sulfolobales archaeon]|nr:DUF2070 family protein [Ignisphaera sp.]MCX8199750.1 DUF2070 family protein [Sulfolobales archaeon]MDW8085012.1 DUF2070 family protein [Ignisphaera sp.]
MLDSMALKYYRFLRIPSKIARHVSLLYPLYILLIVLIDLLSCSIKNQCGTPIFFAAVIIHVLHFSAIPLVIKFLVPYMRRRQILNMVIFSTVPGVLLEFLGSLIGVYGMIYTVLPLIGLLILRGLINSKKRIIIMFFIFTLLEALFIVFVDRFGAANIFVRTCMLIFVSVLSIHLNNILSSYKWEVDVFELSSAWAKYMFTGIDDDIEFQISKLKVERDIKVHSIIFRRRDDTIAMIVPGVHFGPFKTLGSTLLPHYLDEMLNSKGIKTFVLHGAGSHELDLINKNEAKKLAGEIVDKIFNNFSLSEKYEVIYEPFRVYDEFYEAFVIQTSNLAIIAISSPIIGGDDIPYEVQKHTEEITPIYGFKHGVIIDCHNIEGLRVADPNKFNPIVMASISIRKKACSSFKTGYGESSVYGNVRGLCINKIKVLTIECDDAKYSLIYLYGNNAKIGLRDLLRRIAINNGIRDAEVITLDDHSCAGTVFDSPYYAVEVNENIVRAVERALRASITDLSETKVSLVTHNSKVNVVGLKIFELLELAKQVGGFLARYLKLVLIVIHIALLATILLLNLLSI